MNKAKHNFSLLNVDTLFQLQEMKSNFQNILESYCII